MDDLARHLDPDLDAARAGAQERLLSTIVRRASWGFAVCAMLGLVGLWALGSVLTRPSPSFVPDAPGPARSVSLRSSSDVRIAGTYWPAPEGAPALLLLHGNGGNRAAFFETGAWLNSAGYAVLAIDFRGHGQSSSAPKSFGWFEADDALSAFAWLHRLHPASRIGVIGYSLGGAASLLGKGGPLPADALVLEAVYPDIRRAIFDRLAIRLGSIPARIFEPFLSYQSVPRLGVWPADISPIHALARVKAPVMIVGGDQDKNTPLAETEAMFAVVKDRGQLRILEGYGHEELAGPQPETFRTSLLAFLKGALKPKP